MDILHELTKVDNKKIGILDAKIVRVKSDRECRYCNRKISKGETVVTASHLVDKKYNVCFEDVDATKGETKYRYVPVRFWACNSCVEKQLKSKLKSNGNKPTNLKGTMVVCIGNRLDSDGECERHHIKDKDSFEKALDCMLANDCNYNELLEVAKFGFKHGYMSHREYAEFIEDLDDCFDLYDCFDEF